MPHRLLRAATALFAAACALVAFEVTARAHAMDTLLASSWCGDGMSQTFRLLGHCAACWVNGALAGVSAYLSIELMPHLHRRIAITQRAAEGD